MEESLKNDIEEIKIDSASETSLIKDYFKEDQSGKIKKLADLFGQSELELKKEFASFKAKKVYKKLNYFIDGRFRLNGDVLDILNTATKYGFYGVTVYPTVLPLAVSLLYGDSVKIRVLIDYPYGESTLKSKRSEIKRAIKGGANECLVCVSSYLIKNAEEKDFIKSVQKLVKTTGDGNLSLLLDTAILSKAEIERVINLVVSEGVYSVVLSRSKGALDKNLVGELASVFSGKIKVECFDDINCSELAVSTLLGGVDVITSEYCEDIVLDFSKKINACDSEDVQALDKTVKE